MKISLLHYLMTLEFTAVVFIYTRLAHEGSFHILSWMRVWPMRSHRSLRDYSQVLLGKRVIFFSGVASDKLFPL